MSRLILVFLIGSLIVNVAFWQRSIRPTSSASASGVTIKSDAGQLSLASSDLKGVVDHFADLAGVKTIDLQHVEASQTPSPPVTIDDLETLVLRAGVKIARTHCRFEELGSETLPALTVTRQHGQAILLLARNAVEQQCYAVTRLGMHGWIPDDEVRSQFSGELIWIPAADLPSGIWIPSHAVGAGLLPEIGESTLRFAILNRSMDQVASIQGVSTSCGCTSVMSYPRQVPARGMGDVELKINPAKSRSKTNFSQQVLFDLGDQKVEKMQVFGNLAPVVACDPLHRYLGEIPEDGVDDMVSFVYCPDPAATEVRPYAVDPGLVFLGTSPEPDAQRVRLNWRLHRGRVDPNDQMRFRRGANFLIRYPGAEGNTLETVGTFLVHGTKVTELQVAPRALFAGTLKPGNQWDAEIQILNRLNPDKTVVHSSHPRDVTAIIEGQQIKVKVLCPAGVTPGFHAANLLVTDSDKCINIPVSFVAAVGAVQLVDSPEAASP
jgi:hypothetical protein